MCSERGTRQAHYVEHIIWALSPTYFRRGKKQVLTFVSVSILALVTRHAMRMRRVILLLSITFLHVVS